MKSSAPFLANTHLTRIHFHSGLYESAASYANVTTTRWPWQTIVKLRPQLDIPAINAGRKYNMPPEPYGIVFNGMEGSHALAGERGHILLTSGTEMLMALYRGHRMSLKRNILASYVNQIYVTLVRTLILPGVTSEDGVVAGALSFIKRNCQAFGIYIGNPARRVKERKRDLPELEQRFMTSKVK